MMSSPKSVFCHANHARVKLVGSSTLNDSCMNPVPASVDMSISIQYLISSSSSLVKAFIMMLMGHAMSYPMWGPPIPSPALPRKK